MMLTSTCHEMEKYRQSPYYFLTRKQRQKLRLPLSISTKK